MFTVVVWATDGSEAADRALPYAKALATGDGRSLVVIHVKERFVGGRSTGSPVLADEDEIEAKIHGQVDRMCGDGLDATFNLAGGAAGHTAHLIADAAREAGADVIVVGTRGNSTLAGLLIGSVTQGLLQTASSPVLAVPPHDQSSAV